MFNLSSKTFLFCFISLSRHSHAITTTNIQEWSHQLFNMSYLKFIDCYHLLVLVNSNWSQSIDFVSRFILFGLVNCVTQSIECSIVYWPLLVGCVFVFVCHFIALWQIMTGCLPFEMDFDFFYLLAWLLRTAQNDLEWPSIVEL